jgi:MFS transporter, DHA1 family, tetracycline resistance protein
MKNTRLLTIFLIVFVDLLGFSLILPLLPYYAEQYGATPFTVGLLVASYAAGSLLGAPFLGRLSDCYGRRPILLVSVFGTLLGFLFLGFADPIGRMLAGWMAPASANAFIMGVLFFARILDGITAGNLTIAQAYISDVTDENTRAQGLGLIGAAFGLGFIIGPAVGGLLSSYGFNIPALAAAGIAAVNMILIWSFLPESLTDAYRNEICGRRRPAFSFAALISALNRPVVGPLLLLRLFYGMAFAIFQSIFSLYAKAIGLSADTTGYVLAYVGLLAVVVQAGLIGPLTKRFPENRLILVGLWMMTGALIGWAFSDRLWLLLIVLVPLALSGGVLNTVIQSAISKSVNRDEIGGTLGISVSLDSVTRVIAPALGGFLLQSYGIWAPGIFGAFLMIWAVIFTYWRIVGLKMPAVEATPA